MLFHGCSLPLIVQALCSLFPEQLLLFSQISAKYFGVCHSQKNNPKILEYFEYTINSGVAGGFKIMYLLPISKEPRVALRTLSSI